MTGVKVAALYIRVSTDDQTEYSPDAQKRAMMNYAKSNGYIVDKNCIYVDEGISGRSAENRPAFMRMIAQAKSANCPFDTILVHKFDRFARSREDSVVYKSLLRKDCDIKVISITESIEDDKFSIILESMLEAMAEYYSINLSEEVKKGMTEKARRGGLQSSPPYGYTVENNILVPVPSEAELVHEMFSRFCNGEGLYPIAKWLNSIGARTHRGNRFENRTVEYIIRNPAYIGKLRWNPTGKTRRDYSNENIILADAKHEPLITEELWKAAQQRMDTVKAKWKYKARPTYELKDWPSGIVRCATCGGTLVFVKPRYYKCNNYCKGACKTSQHIRADLLKEAIIERMEEDCKTDAELSYKVTYTQKNGKTELQSLNAALETANRKKDRIRDAYLAGVDTIEEYRSYKETIESKISDIQSKIAGIESVAKSKDLSQQLKVSIEKSLATLQAPDASVEEKHNAVVSVVENCTFNKALNLLEIEYRVIF